MDVLDNLKILKVKEKYTKVLRNYFAWIQCRHTDSKRPTSSLKSNRFAA